MTTYNEIAQTIVDIQTSLDKLRALFNQLTKIVTLEELGLENKQIELLHSVCINTVSDLCKVTKESLISSMPSWEYKRHFTTNELDERLAKFGLSFAKETDHSVIDLITVDDVSVRLHNCLKRAKCYTWQQVANQTPKDIRKIRNLGKGSYEELLRVLDKKGYILKEN